MGSALAALLCTAGVAKAQDYYDRYGRVYDNGTETVIVHPDYDDIEKRQLLGRVNGEVNPTEYTLSRPVNFSDLDLTSDEDYLELKARVRITAENLAPNWTIACRSCAATQAPTANACAPPPATPCATS